MRGEITGFSRASSGHCYFTLKDGNGQIRCAMFRRAAGVLDFTPQRVCLDMGDTLVTLYGEELRIESFAGKRLILAGRFARVELRSKWEVPPDEG